MNEQKSTTIRLTFGTRDRLKALGKKGETFDELINRILETVKLWNEQN